MKRSRFSAEQITMALRQVEAGTPVAEICRSLQVTEATFYRWKTKYGSLGTPEIRELRQLRDENRKLKQLVADLTLDKHIQQESLKKVLRPRERRLWVEWAQSAYRVSVRRACRASGFARSSIVYRSRRPSQGALRRRLREMAGVRISYGYQRLHVLLRREGWPINRWAMDFMHDRLSDGRSIRVLTVIDMFTRECLALEVRGSFRGENVAMVLSDLVAGRGKPRTIQCDQGTEFTSLALDRWAYWNRVGLSFSRPGKPGDNARNEAFNGLVRRECLSQHCFLDRNEAAAVLNLWKEDYNKVRPHGSLGQLTPACYGAGWSRTNDPERLARCA